MSSIKCGRASRWLQRAISGFFLVTATSAGADLNPGLLNDFETGTNESWMPTDSTANIATGGPLGAGDGYLEISPGIAGSNLAAFNLSVAGVIEMTVNDVEADMMRPAAQGDLEVRLVLFGPTTGDRWTSTVAEVVPGDGVWRTYTFPIFEADLTQVLGTATYGALEGGLNRIMFRHDAGPPDAFGEGGSGVLNIDNVFVPEPGAGVSGITGLWILEALRRSRSLVARAGSA